MGTADVEIKVPVAENPELSLVPSFTPRVDHSIYIAFACVGYHCNSFKGDDRELLQRQNEVGLRMGVPEHLHTTLN